MFVASVQKVSPKYNLYHFHWEISMLMYRVVSRRVLSTRMMGDIMTLWPSNTQITVAPAMNGRIWLNCTSGVLPVMGLKRILEGIDSGEVDWEDMDALRKWVKKQEIILG